MRLFFMPDVNELDFVLPRPEGLNYPVDAVAGQSKNYLNSPVNKRVNQNIRCIHRYVPVSFSESLLGP